MWVFPKMVSLQTWKHHRRTSLKGIPSRIKAYMHARPAPNIWKYFAYSISEKDRANKRPKRKVWKSERRADEDGQVL